MIIWPNERRREGRGEDGSESGGRGKRKRGATGRAAAAIDARKVLPLRHFYGHNFASQFSSVYLSLSLSLPYHLARANVFVAVL